MYKFVTTTRNGILEGFVRKKTTNTNTKKKKSRVMELFVKMSRGEKKKISVYFCTRTEILG
jgi:hypothetical protein